MRTTTRSISRAFGFRESDTVAPGRAGHDHGGRGKGRVSTCYDVRFLASTQARRTRAQVICVAASWGAELARSRSGSADAGRALDSTSYVVADGRPILQRLRVSRDGTDRIGYAGSFAARRGAQSRAAAWSAGCAILS